MTRSILNRTGHFVRLLLAVGSRPVSFISNLIFIQSRSYLLSEHYISRARQIEEERRFRAVPPVCLPSPRDSGTPSITLETFLEPKGSPDRYHHITRTPSPSRVRRVAARPQFGRFDDFPLCRKNPVQPISGGIQWLSW